MTHKENLKNVNIPNQSSDDQKEVDITAPCDPLSPDYPWVPCGLTEKEAKELKNKK